MEHKKSSLISSLMELSALPLLLIGIGAMVISSFAVYTSTISEIEATLRALSYSIKQIYETAYDGDYSYQEPGKLLKKGDRILSGDFTIIDRIAEINEVDATVFFGEERILTTIREEDGERAIGTEVSPDVAEMVLYGGKEYFSKNVSVNGKLYFGYYIPVRESDNQIVGMIFAGKSRNSVLNAVARTVFRMCLLLAFILSASEIFALMYARNIITSLDKIKEYLRSVAKGDLDATIDETVLNREDELGEMGRFASILQSFITDQVGTDPLTGMYNRRCANVGVDNLLLEYEKNGELFSLAIGDIDWFKTVNDTYGHQAGDEVLKNIASICMEYMERRGFVFRWGGEEFLFLFERMDRDQAAASLEALLERIRSSYVEYEGKRITVTMTIGVTQCQPYDTADSLIRRADGKLYLGKQNKKNQVV